MEIYFNFYFYDLCYDIHGLHKSLGTCRAVGQNIFMFWDSVLNRCAGAKILCRNRTAQIRNTIFDIFHTEISQRK